MVNQPAVVSLNQTKCFFCLPVRQSVMFVTAACCIRGCLGLLEVSGSLTGLFPLTTVLAKALHLLWDLGDIVFGAAGFWACHQGKPVLLRYYLYWSLVCVFGTVPFFGALLISHDPGVESISRLQLVLLVLTIFMLQLYLLWVTFVCLHQLHTEKDHEQQEDEYYLRLPLWVQDGPARSMRILYCIPLQLGVFVLAFSTVLFALSAIFGIVFFPHSELVFGGQKSTKETRAMAFLLDVLGIGFGVIGISAIITKHAQRLGLFFYYELARLIFFIPITALNLIAGNNLCGSYVFGIAGTRVQQGPFSGENLALFHCTSGEVSFFLITLAVFAADGYFVYATYKLWQVYRNPKSAGWYYLGTPPPPGVGSSQWLGPRQTYGGASAAAPFSGAAMPR